MAAFVSMLLDDLADLVKDEVSMLCGVKDGIKRLQEKFGTIKAVLADAENKGIQDKTTDDWLKKLKDVMYDTDDILDECRIEAEKPKTLFTWLGKIAFAHQIGKRIQELNHRLENLWAERSNLNLQLSSADRDEHRSTSRVSRKTSSIPEPDIVGSNIEVDTEKLVELLIKEDTRENVLVYAIVGTGGIGKTTLARKIFNDERITANFPEKTMKLWVCVSKEFEENSLLKDIITQAGGDPKEVSSRELLESMVRDAVTLTNKKFLLVLDDLWNPNVWNDLLQKPLQSGATGSRVLVTTRDEGVASQMKAVAPFHKVEPLSTDDGWALLCKKVVSSGQEREIEDLKDIGKEIVDKCGGLPLAIKTIGGVLSRKSRNEKDWDKVLRILSSNPWSSRTDFTDFPKEVQPALCLSYEDLPSHLKQCFLHCSVFPEDHEFRRSELIHFWISEGFIHEEGGLTLEELGEVYYRDLVQRSFFEPVPRSGVEDPRCTVHDLLWSLARFLAGDENLVVKAGVEVPINPSSVKPRRLLYYDVAEEKRQEFIDALEERDSLRTMLLPWDSQLEENVVNNLIKKTPRLRVLNLASSKMTKLLDFLGNLVHLRFLDLSWTKISELPESIGNLVNLQFLILRFCSKLRSLPKGIGKLHNLRCLNLDWTSVEGLPIEVANLHRLNTLTRFVVESYNSNGGWCTLKELRSLEKLVLFIKNLERASNEGEVRRVNALKDMLKLKVLELSCPSRTGDHGEPLCDFLEEEINGIEEIFEVTLCPPSPSPLESLRIHNFFGGQYPSWIASSTSMGSLRQLNLIRCLCPQLPPLGNLPNLETLFVDHADAVKKIGTEFLGGRTQSSFPKLTTLIFWNMKNWENWEWEVKDDGRLTAWPNLKHLQLSCCLKLRSLPSGLVHHATTLTSLNMVCCNRMKDIRGFSSVEELYIHDCTHLEVVSDLPSLKTLALTYSEMRSLPESFHGGQPDFPALNELRIRGTDELLRGCLKNGLDWPKIEHIPYVYAERIDRSERPFGSGYISKSPITGFKTNLKDYAEDPSDYAGEPSDSVEEE